MFASNRSEVGAFMGAFLLKGPQIRPAAAKKAPK